MPKLKKLLSLAALLFTALAATYAAQAGYNACYPAPLSDARVRSNYQFMQRIVRATPAQLEKMYRQARGEVSSPAALKRAAVHYTSRPVSYHLNLMRNYRAECARASRGGGGGGGDWTKPEPECTSPHQCGGSTQCVDGKCEQIGSTAGNCHYHQCPSGYNCQQDGICR